MKNIGLLVWVWFGVSFGYAQKESVNVTIDLQNISNDKVKVQVTPLIKLGETTTYCIPKIIPGTYSEDNYGKYIENFEAFDAQGNKLSVTKSDENLFQIQNAKNLKSITYWVNDTYDIEGTHEIFSPSGTNILENENFVLNNHGFVGYFQDKKNVSYTLTINHPALLKAASAMIDANPSESIDVFNASNYAKLIDQPIMYARSAPISFMLDDLEISISVYSPTGKIQAEDVSETIKTMMLAQKRFLGTINNTKKYAILLYLTDMSKPDAQGYGALEHNTSTTVVFPEMMGLEELSTQLLDVVSHEFFHTLTPLSIHSEEIQNFDFNSPKMSEHLWLYEGVTEYFANLFQVNQGLISEEDFYKRMSEKIEMAKGFDDTMNFTFMSKNILNPPYKDAYYNVYLKGALIAMCIDIQMRESSFGTRGILSLMKDLSNQYGIENPFKDSELFDKITALTYPEIGAFLNTYVSGTTPIPYDVYFKKMGVEQATYLAQGHPFLKGQTPTFTIDPSNKLIMVIPDDEMNVFYKTLDIKGGDYIISVDGKEYTMDNVYDLFMESSQWKTGNNITIRIKRDGAEIEKSGVIQIPSEQRNGYNATDDTKKDLKTMWLKG